MRCLFDLLLNDCWVLGFTYGCFWRVLFVIFVDVVIVRLFVWYGECLVCYDTAIMSSLSSLLVWCVDCCLFVFGFGLGLG